MSSLARQQINLYQDQFHPVKEVMSVMHCLLLLGLVVIVFGAITGLKFKQLQDARQEIVKVDQRHQQLMTQLSDFASSVNQKRKVAIKKEDIHFKESELKIRRKLLDSLNHGRYGSTQGFSDYLVALARQHVTGSWITGLSVLQGGDQVSVAGSVLEPELAPVYLQKLAKEAAFSGKRFSVLELSRSETQSDEDSNNPEAQGHIDFIIRTNNDDVMDVGGMGNES